MINATQLERTQYWLNHFRQIHGSSIPLRIHSRAIAADGAPEWSPQMTAYMGGELPLKVWQKDSDQKRLKRAMKRIRERSLREYEVLRRVMDGEPIEDVTTWLNERSERGGHAERYTLAQAVVILYAAVDKLYEWY